MAPGGELEMHALGSRTRSTDQKLQGWGPGWCASTSFNGDSDAPERLGLPMIKQPGSVGWLELGFL